MSTLIIDNLPDHLHLRLKERAAHNHRSMPGEAVVILGEMLGSSEDCDLPEPIKTKTLLTHEMIDRAKREGRE